jgi:hypothetical protein
MILLTGPNAPSGERATSRSWCDLVFRLASHVDAVLELPSGFRGATSTKAIPRDGALSPQRTSDRVRKEWRAPPLRWYESTASRAATPGAGRSGKRRRRASRRECLAPGPRERPVSGSRTIAKCSKTMARARTLPSPGQAGRGHRCGQIPKAPRSRGQLSSRGTEAMAGTWCSSGTRIGATGGHAMHRDQA